MFLKSSLITTLEDKIPEKAQVAIVSFQTVSKVEHPLVTVDAETRKSLIDTVKELTVRENTCIGCGLLEAIKVTL